MRLDLPHPFVAMLQHAFMPFGVEHAGAGFQRHLFIQAAHHARPLGLVTDVHRRCHSGIAILLVLGLQHCPADTAQGVEIGVDAGDAQFHRIEVLVGE